jgi:predicted porin
MRDPLTTVATALFLITAPTLVSAQPVIVDQQLLLHLQETIHTQQQQLQQQSEQIKAQSEVLKKLQQQITALQKPASSVQPVAAAPLQTAAPTTITSGNDKIKLAISGQINRAFNITNDGSSTQIYPVDNDASNSRVRFTGTAQINDDLTLGTRIEVAIAADESAVVSQSSQASGDYFNQRWVEASLTSKTFGKLSIGKGDTASNVTAESDLSKTDVVQYAGIADISGGMYFREKNGIRKLTTLKVSDAFKSLDGLSRQSRLRYDSPRLFGFSLAGSLVSGQRSDLALVWGGEGYGLKATGAFAVSNPKLTGVGLTYDGSFSVLHGASGLNLTLSGGLNERDARYDATNLYLKLGWLSQLTKLGYTAFAIDYTRSEQMALQGDKGYSIGGAVVQAFEKYATELYLQYRIYSLDRATGNQPVADITVGTFGARVKF